MRWIAAQAWEEERGMEDWGIVMLVTNKIYVFVHSRSRMLALFTAVLYLITGYLSSTGDEYRCEVGV
jgi:hypothetical protein